MPTAVRGLVAGEDVIACRTDALTVGGATGAGGCHWIVTAIDTAVREPSLAHGHTRTAGGVGRALDQGVVNEFGEPAPARHGLAESPAPRGTHGNTLL